MLIANGSTRSWMMFLVREWEINPQKKIRDPAGIWTQDLLNTSQTLLPLSHLDPLGRGAEDKLHKQHCPEASAEFQLIITLSRLDWTEGLVEHATITGPVVTHSRPSSRIAMTKAGGEIQRLMLIANGSTHSWMMFVVREWEINPRKKIRDPAGIRTQDLLNTSQNR